MVLQTLLGGYIFWFSLCSTRKRLVLCILLRNTVICFTFVVIIERTPPQKKLDSVGVCEPAMMSDEKSSLDSDSKMSIFKGISNTG